MSKGILSRILIKNCYFAGIKGLSGKDSVVSRLFKTYQCIGLGHVNFLYIYGGLRPEGKKGTNNKL